MVESELFLYSYVGLYDRSTEKLICLDTVFIPTVGHITNLRNWSSTRSSLS